MECVSEPRLCARPNTRARKSRRVRQETARGRCVQLPLLVARAARPGLPARVVEASWFQNRRCSKIAIEVRSDEQQEKSNRLINHHRDAALSRARAPLHRRELSSKARRYARFTTIAISSPGQHCRLRLSCRTRRPRLTSVASNSGLPERHPSHPVFSRLPERLALALTAPPLPRLLRSRSLPRWDAAFLDLTPVSITRTGGARGDDES